jgi:hypothetical protein
VTPEQQSAAPQGIQHNFKIYALALSLGGFFALIITLLGKLKDEPNKTAVHHAAMQVQAIQVAPQSFRPIVQLYGIVESPLDSALVAVMEEADIELFVEEI